uniref:Uncharacterized protein n=1 Tax=Arundo donax TaxID=35708 RepID=A0A0A9G9X4_ARUDO
MPGGVSYVRRGGTSVEVPTAHWSR